MSRRETTLDPQVAAELAQLDAALAGARIDDAELEALVRDVRTLTPAIDPAFEARLAARVAEGFARERRAGAEASHSERRRPRPLRTIARAWRRWPVLVPALGVASSILVVVVVIGLARTNDDVVHTFAGKSSGGAEPAVTSVEPMSPSDAGAQRAPDTRAGQGADPQADSASGSSSGSASAPAPLAESDEVASTRRKVERAAALTLTTSADGVQDVADRVVRVTQDVGGYVASSQVGTTARGGTAGFRLRVPSTRLDDAIARLSKLAHVRSLDQSTNDITSAFASTTDRLLDARAERRGLQRALGNATDADEIAVLRARLRAASRRVAALEAELRALRRRADLSTVDVAVIGRGKPSEQPGAGGGWSPRDAWGDALRVLEISAGVALIALAVAIPLGLATALAAAATRALRRRRREAALDVI